MRRHILKTLLLSVLPFFAVAQTPGLIVKPASGTGITPLNPNGDAYTSSTTSGFTTNDITQSEILYKVIPAAIKEPTSDIQRGPNALFTDLVQSVDGTGFYVFNDGTNLLFRLRLGSIVSGSKGYSILIDTDQKFGNTGANPDPNYVASTTMNDGNPGFELEVTLETNFRVAVYNVDGTNSPTLVTSYPINSNSQTSVALSRDSGTPDYFYDFFVPMSALGISGSTPIRIAATTVMAPQSAIGGPKSDIFGVDDQAGGGSMNAWSSAIDNQPAFTLNDLTSAGSGISASRTASPVVNNTVASGSNKTVTGTWNRYDAVKPSPAKIYLYQNSVLVDSVVVATGATWSFTRPTIAIGDVFSAYAKATGESTSLISNKVVAASCSPTSTTSTTDLAFSCITRKGMKGTRAANTTIKLYSLTATGSTLVADDNSTTYKITYPTATTWFYDGAGGGGADPCTSASNDITDGAYAITATGVGTCESGQIMSCLTNAATATPTITQTSLTTSSTTISGTAVNGSFIRLFKNKVLLATTTASGTGAYSFTGLTLALKDTMEVYAHASSSCLSAPVMMIVNCTTTTPFITTDNSGNLSTTATAIAGTAFQPAGTTIRIYENAVLVGTTTVGSNYTWSLSYTPVASKVYTATAQNGTCSVSASSTSATALSATSICPSITGSYGSSDTTVRGTLPSSFTGTVRLYQDAVLLGSTSVTSAVNWAINVNRTYLNTLYPGGVLTATAQASGSAEKTGCSSSVTVSCSVPSAPTLSSASATIRTGQAASFSITNSESTVLYSITDASSGDNVGISKFSTGGVLAVSTYSYPSTGTYNVLIKGTNLSGTNCESITSASITVNTILPLKLVSFHANRLNKDVHLQWVTEHELQVEGFRIERSVDGREFIPVGHVNANGSSSQTNYTFVDKQAPSEKVLYYRLRMIDIDQRFEFSTIVKVLTDSRTASSIAPNPFHESFNLTTYSTRNEEADITVSTLSGHIVYHTKLTLNRGTNTTLITSLGLSAGMYMVRILHADKSVEFLKILAK